MSNPICQRCGDPILPHQHSDLLGVCKDCYIYFDMDRFKELEREEDPDTEDKLQDDPRVDF